MSKWIITTNIPGEPTEEFDDYESAKRMYDGLIEGFKGFGMPLGMGGPEQIEAYLAEVKDSNSFEN